MEVVYFSFSDVIAKPYKPSDKPLVPLSTSVLFAAKKPFVNVTLYSFAIRSTFYISQ